MQIPILTPGSILAVDDDRDDRHLLRLLLRKAALPNPVLIYREGKLLISALTKLLGHAAGALRPLVCFLDVYMSTMTGHEVLRWIRAKPELDRLPVIMLSSSENPRDIQQSARDGAQGYLVKYPQPAVLRQVLHDAQRFAQGAPADDCFCFPWNLLLVRCRWLKHPPRVAFPR